MSGFDYKRAREDLLCSRLLYHSSNDRRWQKRHKEDLPEPLRTKEVKSNRKKVAEFITLDCS